MFVNADHMPLENPMFSQAGRRLYGGWFEASADREDWEGWWESIAKEKEMEETLAERERRFGRRRTHEFMPPASWHIQRLSGAGFSSAEIVWRSFDEAVLAAWK